MVHHIFQKTIYIALGKLLLSNEEEIQTQYSSLLILSNRFSKEIYFLQLIQNMQAEG
jgi:hypothetical protein